jgi:hypothetical protein
MGGSQSEDLDEPLTESDKDDGGLFSKKFCVKELGKIYSKAHPNLQKMFIFFFLYRKAFDLTDLSEGAKYSRLSRCLKIRDGADNNNDNNKYFRVLERLMKHKDTTKTEIPYSYSLKTCFKGNLSYWENVPTTVFNLRNVTEIQRVQETALCHFHAAIVMHYYLTKGILGMIDMTQFILSSPFLIEKYIFAPGGSSSDDLRNMLQDNSLLIHIGEDCEDGKFMELFNKFGPFLISGFEVTDDFFDPPTPTLSSVPTSTLTSISPTSSTSSLNLISQSPSPVPNQVKYDFTNVENVKLEVRGCHAMVMVGYNVEKKSGKLILLIQNWWRSRPDHSL